MQKPRIASHAGKVIVSLRKGIHEVDVIRIDGELWMVPEWGQDSDHPALLRPSLMIRIDLLDISTIGDAWVISERIPTHVFGGKQLNNPRFTVRLHPEIYMDRPAS